MRPCGDKKYFTRHDRWNITRRCPIDYIVQDCGYTTSCWIWQLKIGKWEYGQIKVDGKSFNAMRYYYEQYYGPIIKHYEGNRSQQPQIDHLCRIRTCVNPDHLELVTCMENIRRGAQGTLTKIQVQEISDRYVRGESQSQIGRTIGISQTQVSRILRGERWNGVARPVKARRDSNLKLTPEQVIEIRHRATSGESGAAIARSIGMSACQVQAIIRGASWTTLSTV